MSDDISDDKYSESDPERTLITLDQLSQTIEVMTTVVNRLRQHLSEQLKAQIKAQEESAQAAAAAERENKEQQSQPVQQQAAETKTNRESFVVEINNSQEPEPSRKNNKVLH